MSTLQLLLGALAAVLFVVAYYLRPIAISRRRDNVRATKCETALGFGPMEVKGKSTMVFMALPRRGFEGRRLVVSQVIASGFSINSIRVGKDVVDVTANQIPAAAFSEVAISPDFALPQVNGEEFITLSVSNTSDGPKVFSGALVGLMPIAEAA